MAAAAAEGSEVEDAPMEVPPVPPPTAPAVAAAAAPAAAAKKTRKKNPITEGERQLAALRAERAAQRKKLAELRAATKKEKRACAKLNRKASRLSVGELLEVALLKFRTLAATDEEAVHDATAASSSTAAAAAAAPTTEQAISFIAAHVKKQKAAKLNPDA